MSWEDETDERFNSRCVFRNTCDESLIIMKWTKQQKFLLRN